MPEKDTKLIKLVPSFFISRLCDDSILEKSSEEHYSAVKG
jgi:hypothetical protein